MNIFKKEPTFKFLNKRYLAFALSGLIMVLGLIQYFRKGFNLGVDFLGGTMIEVAFKDATSVNQLRKMLGGVGMGGAQITRIGTENKFFIKTQGAGETSTGDYEAEAKRIQSALLTPDEKQSAAAGRIDLNNTAAGEIARFLRSKGIAEEDAQESASIIIDQRKRTNGMLAGFDTLERNGMKHRVLSVLQESTYLGRFSILSVEIVGPQVGQDLRRKATLACIWALIGMLIYIAFRFKFLYGLSGILTLAHDVLICLSFILFFNIELSLQVIAAILTIVGYSINDTIVIFDRLRDNLKIMRKEGLEEILDKTINQTLSRTIFTSLTVLLTVMSLFLFGGEVIHGFAFTMLVGVISGSYSTIYQSCAWLKIWEKWFLKRKKS